MISQVLRLLKLQTVNLFGINEFRYTKDRSKKKMYLALAVVWILVIFMVGGYAGGMSYALVKTGMGNIIPMYVYTVVSLLILLFTFFKAGSIIFSMKGYELLISLPVSKSSVIISRFLSMYVTNLLMAILVMIPAVAVYGVLEKPGISFYVMFLVGVLFAPLLPLTIASILGALITAVSVRVKHKSIVQAVLMVVLIVVVMAGSMFMSNNGEGFSEDMLKNMAQVMENQIRKIYPPALWLNKAVYGQWSYMAAVLLVPLAVFGVFVAILQKHFQSICMKLNAVTTKNNYKIGNMTSSGVLKTLWRRELKRYFASSIYVTNTIVGYVLAILATASIFFVGADRMGELIGIPDFGNIVKSALPFLIALLMSITSMTSCSISMEGKTFWQIQTLPVKSGEVYLSKIMANLTVATPFYVISVIFACLTVKPNLATYFWIIIIPALYLFFMAVVGIRINLAFPVLNWDNEVRVVKQSASTFGTMLVGIITSVVPVACIVLLGTDAINVVRGVTTVVLASVTVVLYVLNIKNSVEYKV